MKAAEFKSLIKEAVREVVREELQNFTKAPVNTTVSTPTIPTASTAPTKPVASSPLMEMINQTRATMSSEDFRNIGNFTSANVAGANFGGPQPGLDLSSLSFVKNAGAILKASNEKDKIRNGL